MDTKARLTGLVTGMMVMETGPIAVSTNELAHGTVTIVIVALLVVAVGLAVVLLIRHHRHREERLSEVEQRLAALEQPPRDRGES